MYKFIYPIWQLKYYQFALSSFKAKLPKIKLQKKKNTNINKEILYL